MTKSEMSGKDIFYLHRNVIEKVKPQRRTLIFVYVQTMQSNNSGYKLYYVVRQGYTKFSKMLTKSYKVKIAVLIRIYLRQVMSNIPGY